MSDRDHGTVERLIPWYANGTLESDGRRQVDAHVRECASCRYLLDQALEQIRFSRSEVAGAATEEVHPLLLTRFAEDPGQLDEETRDWIRARLETSPLSREAFERLQEVADPEVQETSAPAANGIWAWIRGTFLQPAPALAYLLLLLILAPAVWRLRGSPDPAGLPRIVATGGDSTLRTDTARPAAPLEIRRAPGALLLELETSLSATEIDELGATFRLEITRSDDVVSSMPLGLDRFRFREGSGVVTLTLDPLRFAVGAHEIVIRAEKPGDPIDGQPLFRRAVRFTAD